MISDNFICPCFVIFNALLFCLISAEMKLKSIGIHVYYFQTIYGYSVQFLLHFKSPAAKFVFEFYCGQDFF